MTKLREILAKHTASGAVPGAVALVARDGRAEVEATGLADLDGHTPMMRESIFRIASITKPITTAATVMLVDDGLMALDDPVEQWLPELASPMVVRTPSSAVDDVVPANRPITVLDLLTNRTLIPFQLEPSSAGSSPRHSSVTSVSAAVTAALPSSTPRRAASATAWIRPRAAVTRSSAGRSVRNAASRRPRSISRCSGPIAT